MQSLVSILIPVYNAEGTIGRAIESCLAQTYPHIEILILDDASTDRSKQIASQFGSLKITVLSNPENQGIARSRNNLLKHARGEYIAWLDADDTMSVERIDEQVGFMQGHPGIDIAGSWIFTDSAELPSKKLLLLHSQIKTMLWFKNCMIQPSVISKNFYKKENTWYDSKFKHSVEDYDLWYRLAPHKKFANIPLYLTTYHMTSGSSLADKQAYNEFRKNLEMLWQKKWKDVHVDISERDKTVFQDFLYENKRLNHAESESIRSTLNKLKQTGKDPFFNLIISFHQLRLWKNMNIGQKFNRLYLLNNLVFYLKMKRNHLIN